MISKAFPSGRSSTHRIRAGPIPARCGAGGAGAGAIVCSSPGGARSALSEFGELTLEVAHLLLELIGGLSNGDFDWPTFTVKPRWLMTFFRYGSSCQSTTAR